MTGQPALEKKKKKTLSGTGAEQVGYALQRQAFDGHVAHVPARRRVVVRVGIIDEIARQRRRVGGAHQPRPVTLQAGDIQRTCLGQAARVQRRIAG